MSLLELENISTGYGHFQALFDVNLRIEEGETHAIIGANGAGKSTLLRTICGLIAPTRTRCVSTAANWAAAAEQASGFGNLLRARGTLGIPKPHR